MEHIKGLAAGIGILAVASSLVWAQASVPGQALRLHVPASIGISWQGRMARFRA